MGRDLLVRCLRCSSHFSVLLLTSGCSPEQSPRAEPSATGTVCGPSQPPTATPPAADTVHLVAENTLEQLLQALAYQKRWPELKHYAKQFELTPSDHDPALKDSIVTYSTPANSFVYSKSGSPDAPGGVLMRCQLRTTATPITPTIHLGMSQAELARVIGQPFTADVLLLTEQEGYQKFFFSFKNQHLAALTFESDYID